MKNEKQHEYELDKILSMDTSNMTKDEAVATIKRKLQAENERLLQETRDDLWNHLRFIN